MSAAGLSVAAPLPRPLAPPPRGERPGWSRGWRGLAFLLSLLLHLAAVWWLLFGIERRVVQEPAGDSAMEMVFEGGAAESTPPPPPSGESAPLEPPEVAALAEPPAPAPVPPVAEPPGAAPMVGEAPPMAAPPPPLAAAPAPPVTRAVPAPEPLPAQPAPSELPLPPPMAEAPREMEMAALPLPPPPAPQPPAAPPETMVARPATPQQPRARAAAPGSPFAGALDLSQGPPVSLGRPAAPPRPSAPGARRDRDAMASVAQGAADAPNAQLRIRGANLGENWRSAFMAWLRQHGYYPRQAVEAGEDGTAVVRFTVDRSGKVSGLQLIGRSGSVWLDAGAQALLRGRTVPSFPPGTQEDSAEIDLTINYILRRH
ncbi:energy transducer TonB [Roseomonas xinghualingensis]|uniref:energy transducer TonB n=1 Tax=Roseomonas xinghualingensis TaxID=2986475 RepID=UPI0021F0D52C|nr:energy transducer TonB [Roseomonas sp. SXEYE001]MCV4206174.1 energy transducer TonB [Roseomonas sp. SXEYE001]